MSFYKVVATSTGGSQVSWITSTPNNPYKDYYAIGTHPPRDELGTYEIYPLTADDASDIWSSVQVDGKTHLSPVSGGAKTEEFWSRHVDSTADVVLKLSQTNMSTSWVRINDTDIMPRSQK